MTDYIPIANIADDEQIVLGDFEYPNIDLETIELPIVYRNSRLESMFATFVALIFLVISLILHILVIKSALINQQLNGLHVIGLMTFLSMLVFSTITTWQYVIRSLSPAYLIIDRNSIHVRQNLFKTQLLIIPYEHLYGVFTLFVGRSSYHRLEYQTTIHYLTLSVDGLEYQTHSLKLTGLPLKYYNLEYSLKLTALIRQLIQRYHEENNLVGTLPRIRVIEQR